MRRQVKLVEKATVSSKSVFVYVLKFIVQYNEIYKQIGV